MDFFFKTLAIVLTQEGFYSLQWCFGVPYDTLMVHAYAQVLSWCTARVVNKMLKATRYKVFQSRWISVSGKMREVAHQRWEKPF